MDEYRLGAEHLLIEDRRQILEIIIQYGEAMNNAGVYKTLYLESMDECRELDLSASLNWKMYIKQAAELELKISKLLQEQTIV